MDTDLTDDGSQLDMLVESYLILPTQFQDMHTPELAPEQRLMLAVLEEAIRNLRNVKKPQLAEQARAWILSEEEGWPFSFLRVCEALHISARRVRQRLQTNIKEKRSI